MIGTIIMTGRVLPLSSGCLLSSNDTNSMSQLVQPKPGRERKRERKGVGGVENSPINSIQKITSPTGNHCQVQMNLHILHVFLCFHLSCQRSIFRLHSYQCDVSKTLIILRKIQCTTAYQKNNHLARGENSIALGSTNQQKPGNSKLSFTLPP